MFSVKNNSIVGFIIMSEKRKKFASIILVDNFSYAEVLKMFRIFVVNRKMSHQTHRFVSFLFRRGYDFEGNGRSHQA